MDIINSKYNLNIVRLESKTNKSSLLYCNSGTCFLLKELEKDSTTIYEFLNNIGVSNVIIPKLNNDDRFITKINNKYYYLTNYYRSNDTNLSKKANDLFDELTRLHKITSFPIKMTQEKYRTKFDELIKRIDYKFKIIEEYIRSLENDKINFQTYKILEKYNIVLNLKQELIKIQKRLIASIKNNESIEYVFIHNKPKLDHLIYARGNKYLVSIDNGKIGINSLDFAKFYIENQHLNIDFYNLIKKELLNNTSTFKYDYFRYNVLLTYLFNINIRQDIIITLNSFIYNCNNIEKFLSEFVDEKND